LSVAFCSKSHKVYIIIYLQNGGWFDDAQLKAYGNMLKNEYDFKKEVTKDETCFSKVSKHFLCNFAIQVFGELTIFLNFLS
jgi:hypothetical protein